MASEMLTLAPVTDSFSYIKIMQSNTTGCSPATQKDPVAPAHGEPCGLEPSSSGERLRLLVQGAVLM